MFKYSLWSLLGGALAGLACAWSVPLTVTLMFVAGWIAGMVIDHRQTKQFIRDLKHRQN
jgi:hypothetical protein